MVKIISDSTCDLSQELLEQYDVSVLPLHVILGENEYHDGEDITPDEIYKWSDKMKATPQTSAPSLTEAAEMLTTYVDEGREVVYFCISELMSLSGHIMRLAAEEIDAENMVHVIDSGNLSTGIGLLVIEAAIMAKDGKSAQEIVARMEELKPYVRSSFVVDTLIYLNRGGRCTSLAAMAGGLLKFHPRIAVVDGKMEAGKKYRGKMSNVILSYVKDMEDELRAAKKDRVFITHSGCDGEVVRKVQEYLSNLRIFKDIMVARAGSVVSSHCGPGTLGVMFISEN